VAGRLPGHPLDRAAVPGERGAGRAGRGRDAGHADAVAAVGGAPRGAAGAGHAGGAGAQPDRRPVRVRRVAPGHPRRADDPRGVGRLPRPGRLCPGRPLSTAQAPGVIVGRVNRVGFTGSDDDATLRRLWDEHAAPLLAFVLRLTGGDRGRAEDVVQETLLQAWKHPEVLDPQRGPVRPWLLTVARRVAIDHYRARRARPSEVGDEGLADLGVGDGIDEALERWLVSDALATLAPAHREALLHTYYAGRTVTEAATVLGIPVGTVKSRVFYGLRALKLALEERGVTT